MSWSVYALVLLAAALHAVWNAMAKGAPDKRMTLALIACAAGACALPVLPWVPPPLPASWPFIAVSVALQVLYFALLARIYRRADMSVTYPVMRGMAPLLVVLLSLLWPGERLQAATLMGIAVICAGVLCLAWGRHTERPAGLGLALLNAGVIACYTVVDGMGVRRSGAPVGYTLWIFLLTGAVVGAWALLSARQSFLRHAALHWRIGLVGGAGSAVSYGIALWAMTLAPVAVVAALRETSIVFGVLIACCVLREAPRPGRVAGAVIVTVGAVIVRLG